MFSSDAGNLMATEYEQGKMFAATYIDGPKGRIFSLRSTKDGMDVSKIAERFGGGGHKNAAGFTIQVEHHPIISTDFTNERNDNGQSI
jgi:nanoRNase/pAp phosphatase (c-di-AMP/oligoRNAs hydrolase)